jgi:hypothetical protein
MNDSLHEERPDELEELLRRTLARDAERVQPAGDGLQRIRERIETRPTPWWRPAGLAVAGAATVAAATVGVFALTGEEPTARTVPADRPSISTPADGASRTAPAKPSVATGTPPATAPSDQPSVRLPSMSPSATRTTPPRVVTPPPVVGPTVTSAVPVYYAADGWQGPRLFREFLWMSYQGSPGRAAVEAMIAGKPADPDYRSLWASGTEVLAYSRSGSTVSIDVSRMPEGTMGTQQLVYTVTAAEKGADTVALSVAGADRGSYSRAPRIDVEGPIWILEPTQGAVGGPRVTVSGIASVYEANVSWELRRDGAVVDSGFVTADEAAPTRAAWSTELTLEPGTYEFRAYAEAMDDSGRVVGEDTKTFTVR